MWGSWLTVLSIQRFERVVPPPFGLSGFTWETSRFSPAALQTRSLALAFASLATVYLGVGVCVDAA